MRRFTRSRQLRLLAAAIVLGAGCSRNPNVIKQKHLDSGNEYFAKGRYKEAAIMYRRALAKDRMFGEGYYRLALTELKMGEVQNAVRDLYRAAELQPNNEDAVTKLIDIYLAAYAVNPQEGKTVRSELEGIEKRLLEKDPHSYDGLRIHGYLALMRNETEEALTAFEQAQARQPDKPETVIAVVQVLTGQKRFAEADKLALAFLDRHPDTLPLYQVLYNSYVARGEQSQAEALLQRKLEKNPRVASAYVDLAAHYKQAGNEGAAESAIEKMMRQPAGSLDFPADAPSAWLLASAFHQRHGASGMSVALLRQGLASDVPHRLEYQIRLGQHLLNQNLPHEARPLIEDVLKKDASNVDGLTMRAALALSTKKKEDAQAAVADLQKVVSAKPENAAYHLNLGRALTAAGRTEEAIAQYQEAVKLDPSANMLSARFSLAELYQSRRPEPAYAKAQQAASEILAIDANSVPARLLRANAAFYLQRRDPAREDLEAVLRAVPEQADALFQLGRLDIAEGAALREQRVHELQLGDRAAAARTAQLEQERYKLADARFARLQELQDSRAFAGRVEAQAALGHVDVSVAMLKQDLTAHPDKTENYQALGNLYLLRKEYANAQQAFEEVLRRKPETPEAYIKLGTLYQEQQDFGKAEAALQKASSLSPRDVNPLLLLANLYEVGNNRAKAKPLYEKVLQLQSDHPVALNNLAFLLADHEHELDAALTYAQRARLKWPDNREVSDTLGLIYLRKQLPDNALPLLEENTRQEPGRASFRLHLAEAFFQKNQKDQAKRELDAAARNNPSKAEQQKIQELRAKVG